MRATLLGGVLALALGACASVTHKPVEDFDRPDGIPYYGGSHYLLVHSDGKGNVSGQILYLMDPEKKMVAKPESWLASLTSSLTFSGGVLTKSKQMSDTTSAPGAILAAAEELLVASAMTDLEVPQAPPTREVPAPSLYKILVQDDGAIWFIGDEGTETVKVSVTEQKK